MSARREGDVNGPEIRNGRSERRNIGSVPSSKRQQITRGGLVAAMALTAALLSACSTTEPNITPPDAGMAVGFHDAAEVITAKAGDKLKVIAFGLDSLSGDYVVDASGALKLGRFGKVHVAGLTYPQIEEKIAAALSTAGQEGVRVSVLPDNG